MAKAEITNSDVLRQLLNYDPETGLFEWRERDSSWFNEGATGGPDATAGMWNKKFAGRAALNCANALGYKVGRIFNRGILAHRAAWMIQNGDIPGELVIDHLDGDRSNNKIANLRAVSRKVNQRNMKLGRCYLGGIHKHGKKWRVVVAQKRIGSFETYEAALTASLHARANMGFTDRHGA